MQTAQVNIKVDSTQAVNSVGKLNEEVNKTNNSVISMRTELRKITDELQALEPGSARFKELSLRAAELRDTIADTDGVVNLLAGNFTERLTRGISGTIQVGLAGFQALSAAQALFGTENEELQQTLVKLTALLNLSQAIETFSGLDQKIVEIKASFASLTTATVTQTVATEGQAVATTGAAVATTALGTAMKALPIIGLVAAIGTLVYGIYQYFSASKKTAEQEAERKKQLEDLKKEQEDYNTKLADETGEFLLLIGRIKETNENTSERTALLKELNTTYGVNLQNIRDEKTLLEELDTASEKFIEYQKTKLRFQQNQDKFNKLLEKQIVLEDNIQIAIQRVNREQEFANTLQDRTNPMLFKAQEALNKLQLEYQANEISLKKLSQTSNDYDKTLKELNGTVKTQAQLDEEARKAQEAKDKALRAYQQTLQNYAEIQRTITDLEQKAFDAESALLSQRQQRGDNSIDLVERERDARLAAVEKVYNETKIRIDKEVKDKKKKATVLNDLEKAYTEYVKYESQQRLERELDVTKQIIDANQKRLNGLYDEESKLGMDSIRLFDEREKEKLRLEVQGYDKQIEKQELALANYKKLMMERLKVLQKQIDVEAGIEKVRLDEELGLNLKAYDEKLREDEKFTVERKLNEQGLFEYNIQLNEEYLKKNANMSRLARNQLILEAQQTQDNANQYLLNEYQKVEDEKTKITEEASEKRKEVEEETNNQISENTINTYIMIADYIAETFNQIASIISEFQRRAMEDQTQKLEDAVAMDKERIESNYAAGIISKEQYDNEVEQLEQKKRNKELQLARKAFEQKKTLDIIGATIDGARAVLSTFAQTPGELIIKSIAAGIAAAFSAVQIGIIASQKFRAAKGGIVPGDGSGQIDSVDAQLAPGEAVINEMSTRQFLPLLSAINESNGGRSFMPDLPATNSNQQFSPVFTQTPTQEQIVRAYVVESDISDAQRRINRIEKSVTF